MNLINCSNCGVLFDKDILIKNLRLLNLTVEYLERSIYLDCPVCKDVDQFYLSEVQE